MLRLSRAINIPTLRPVLKCIIKPSFKLSNNILTSHNYKNFSSKGFFDVYDKKDLCKGIKLTPKNSKILNSLDNDLDNIIFGRKFTKDISNLELSKVINKEIKETKKSNLTYIFAAEINLDKYLIDQHQYVNFFKLVRYIKNRFREYENSLLKNNIKVNFNINNVRAIILDTDRNKCDIIVSWDN